MNLENVETWHGIIISPAQHARKSREGHGKNWTHFVYKLDKLFPSIRVSESGVGTNVHPTNQEESHGSCVSFQLLRVVGSRVCFFLAHVSRWIDYIHLPVHPLHTSTSSSTEYKSFGFTFIRPTMHLICIYMHHEPRLGCMPNSFRVSGFRTRTHLLHGHFNVFNNLFELWTSFVFSMQHSKQCHQFPTCSDIICCFSVIYLIVQRAK